MDAESRPEISSGADPATAMYQVLSGTSRVSSNGGALAGLVGSHAQVIDRIAAFHEAGIELFMLQFQPLETELDHFAAEIIPRLADRKAFYMTVAQRTLHTAAPAFSARSGPGSAGAAARHRRDAARKRRRRRP